MVRPGDWVLDELNKRVVESLIYKSRSDRVTGHSSPMHFSVLPWSLAASTRVGKGFSILA